MKHKRFIIYSFFLLLFCWPMQARTEKGKLTIQLQDVTLSRIIDEVEKQTDYTFFINDSRIDINKKVSISINNGELKEVLDKTFATAGYNYSIVEKQILISHRPVIEDTSRTLTGTITDDLGEPITGATIQVKNTTNGTISDIDGHFSITIPNEKAVLLISFLGFKPIEITNIGNRNNLRITMEEDTRQLNEVVIIGYGVQSKKTLTGAVSVVKFDEIEAPTVTTISHALAGKAAGLRVNQQSAQPGGGAKFRIRGEGSVNASNDPLIVIDGFPVSSGSSFDPGNIYEHGTTDNLLESLNPDDIESISVLKDAASTAIYGARAGHGVILITTKRGKNQKARVSYSGNISVQKIQNSYEMLDTQGYMDMRNKQLYEEYLKSNALGIYKDYITLPADHTVVPYQPMYTNDQILRVKGTNWLDEVTRTGIMHQHNVSINGGNETTRYMTSINYMKQDGIIKNNGTQRFTARLNLDQEINRYISVGLTATYTQNKYDNVPLGDKQNEYSGVITGAVQANPAIPVRDEKGDFYIDPYRPFVANPVSLLDITDVTEKDRLMGLGFITAKPVRGLELKFQLGADRRFQKNSNYLPKTTLEGQKHNGAGEISQEDRTDYLMDLTATYDVQTGGHHLKALAGYSFQQFNRKGVRSGNRDFLVDGFLYHNLGAGPYEKPIVSSWNSKEAIASYFARVNYTFQDKYLVEGTIRADGASNFTPENRWGYFPSVSAGWVVSEESFMEKSREWLSNLKIRASYGQTGNSSVGYRIEDFFAVGRHAIFGESQQESSGVFASDLGNTKLTWETTSELNIGLDAGFFRNRLNITFEYFTRRISDLLSEKSLLSFYEVNKIYANIGKTKSKGYEVTVNSVNLARPDLEWNTMLTLAHYEDRWSKRDPEWKPRSYQRADDPIRAWFSYESLGIMQPGDPAPKAQPDLLPGMVILKDQNDDGIINEDDMVYIDSNDPALIFGFNNSVRYKRFDLNIYFYGEIGRKRGASYKESWTRMDNGQNVSVMSYQSFNSNNLTSAHPTYIRGGYGWGDHYVKNISYMRCGNITLGYTIPIPSRLAKSVRVYVDINNPFVITNWSGLDPETDNGDFAYPNIRSYNLGLNVTF